MDAGQVGTLGLVLLLVLLAFGLHIALALALSGFVGLWVLYGFNQAVSLLQTVTFTTIYNYNLTVIPLFLMMGAFTLHSGFATTLYNTASKLFHRVPGSLCVSTTMSCAAFGAVTGSSIATCAIFTKLSLQEMLTRGYAKTISTGCIAAAGGLAAIIPPSGLMVVYAIFTDQSIGKTQMAGILPGIVAAIILSGVTILWVKLRPGVAPRVTDRMSLKEGLRFLPQLWPLVMFIVIIWGGLYSGIFTPNEAASVAAAVAFILLIVRKRRGFGKLTLEVFLDVVDVSAMIFLVIVGAMIFSRFVTATRLVIDAATFITALHVHRLVIFSGIVLVYLVLGMFLEGVSIMALTLPMVMPILRTLGFDPIWFGVIVVILIEIGFITPPVGLNVFAVKGAAGYTVSLSDIFRGMVPYLIGYLILIIILVAFPSLATWIPSLM